MWLPLLLLSITATSNSIRCPSTKDVRPQFQLVRECQRADTDDALALENTASLADCIKLAKQLRGLAFNYAPMRRKQMTKKSSTPGRTDREARRGLSVFQQPEEYFNCHVLECPQNHSFAGMRNDSRFDYYSLYGRPTALHNVSCVPQVGLFVLYTTATNYMNASLACRNASEFMGSLAHVASERRTHGLSKWLSHYNGQRVLGLAEQPILLTYVGLMRNISISRDYVNGQQENLRCFLYSAWQPGYPQLGGSQANASCVALTTQGTWQSLSCERQLPYICEVLAVTTAYPNGQLDTGFNAAAVCYA